jgi:CAAX prenyl protease-like protein
VAGSGSQRPSAGRSGTTQELSDVRHPTLTYIAPFVAFLAVMAIEKATGLPPAWMYFLRVLATVAILVAFSRQRLSEPPTRPLASAALGAAVFALWITPDAIFGPGYRHSWPFQNAVTGAAASSIPAGLRGSFWFLALRTASCTLLVPPMEELFWRGWLMRWLANNDFLKVPPGAYHAMAFWMVALLFAAEHGPYWEVGLVTGVIYNWWMLRTRSLADCIVAHAVTNGLLSIYILATGQFQYWL